MNEEEVRQSGLVYISKVFVVIASAAVGQKESSFFDRASEATFQGNLALWLNEQEALRHMNYFKKPFVLGFVHIKNSSITLVMLWSLSAFKTKGSEAPCLLMVSCCLFIVSIIQQAYEEFQRPQRRKTHSFTDSTLIIYRSRVTFWQLFFWQDLSVMIN